MVSNTLVCLVRAFFNRKSNFSGAASKDDLQREADVERRAEGGVAAQLQARRRALVAQAASGRSHGRRHRHLQVKLDLVTSYVPALGPAGNGWRFFNSLGSNAYEIKEISWIPASNNLRSSA